MDMSFASAFSMFGSSPAYQQQQQQTMNNIGYDPFTQPQQPMYQEQPQPTMSWEQAFEGFKTTPVLYNMDGYISPYASNNWGGTNNLLQYLDDSSRLPALDNKIDPNKIFSAEIKGLRALEADQQKLVKLVERKLMESLSEKGKIGLTEEDIEALSAITSGRAAIANMAKERVNIKKNIADIRIKQNQNAPGTVPNPNAPLGSGSSSMDIGRSILDSIFETPSTPVTPIAGYNPGNIGQAEAVLNSLVPGVNNNLSFESMEPKTWAVVGDTDDDVELVTFDKNGNVILGYDNPNVAIERIDRSSGKAWDQYMQEYDIKFK